MKPSGVFKNKQQMQNNLTPSAHTNKSSTGLYKKTEMPLFLRRTSSPDGKSQLQQKVVDKHGTGRPLSIQMRSKVEPVLGTDVSHVRVHDDAKASYAARSINAKAFTHQSDIFLGKGQRVDDIGLIAHELAHVVQQQGKNSLLQRSVSCDMSTQYITPEEASELTLEELREEIGSLNDFLKIDVPESSSCDVISWNIHILEEELFHKQSERETDRKGYTSIYSGFMVAVEDRHGNLLIRYNDGTTVTVVSYREKFNLTHLPEAKSGFVGFKFSMKQYIDPIKRYYPVPIYRDDAPEFHDQLKLLMKSAESMSNEDLVIRLAQINKAINTLGDTEPVYRHILDESAHILGILKKRSVELKEKVKAVRDDPDHVDNNIKKLDMFVEGTIPPGTFVDFVHVKVTYMESRILWLSLVFSQEEQVWQIKESKGQDSRYITRKIPAELRPDTTPTIFEWFYQTYPGVYSERIQKYLTDVALFSQASLSFAEILSMNLMGLNPYWAAVFLGYEGITGKRVFHPDEDVPTWERILNLGMLAAPFVLKRLKFRRLQRPEIPAGEIPSKARDLPVQIEKGELLHTGNKRKLFIDEQGIIRYRKTKRICPSCNPEYYELKGSRYHKKRGAELPGKQKGRGKTDFTKIADKHAVANDPNIPATQLGFDSGQLSKFGPYTNSEAAVQRLLQKKTLHGIKGQLAEEIVNTLGTSEAATIKPKFTEKGSTISYFRGDEVAAPAPKQTSAGAEKANITDGIVAEIFTEGGMEKLYIHRFYEVKSGAASAAKLSAQVGWDMERIKELGISIKVPKPGGGYVWKEFAPQDISMVPRSSQSSVAKGFVPEGVKAPAGRLTEQYQAFEIPGISETDLYEAALMILRRQKGVF